MYGADVVSRIKASDEGHLEHLSTLIQEKIYEQLKKYQVELAVVSANNVMLHLLTGTSPHSIGVSPFEPEFKDLKKLKFGEVFGEGNGEIILLPSISGYVGGDIIAGMLATDLSNSDNTLFIDLGTNGEMVLNANGKLYCTSTAAGPAFEGGNIACGSYARSTAIGKVTIENEEIKIDVKDADCICGSGIIDLTASLVESYVIDETGRLEEDNSLVQKIDNELRVYLNKTVYMSQKDVRSVQLAKAAISGGIKCMLRSANIKDSEIKKVLIAGGFSKNLNFVSCEKIGLIPKGTAELCEPCGNTSILGGLMCLKDMTLLERASELQRETELIDLAKDKNFFEDYTESLMYE